MTVEQLSQIIGTLEGIRTRLVANGEVTESGYSSYNVAEGLVLIAEAIDRNTAAIDALTAELSNRQ